MAEQDLLQQLRDIHYPEPVSWWPLAPGWYGLLILIAIVSFIVGAWSYKRWRKQKQRKFIMQQLQYLENLYEKNPQASDLISQLSALLKRVVLAIYPRQKVAGLSGDAWLAFLDEAGKTSEFSNGVGRLLITAPYQAEPPQQAKELFTLVEQWMKQQIKKKL